jgi:hypothetical protein
VLGDRVAGGGGRGSGSGRGDSRAVIVMPPAEPGSSTWLWEFADTLVKRC